LNWGNFAVLTGPANADFKMTKEQRGANTGEGEKKICWRAAFNREVGVKRPTDKEEIGEKGGGRR